MAVTVVSAVREIAQVEPPLQLAPCHPANLELGPGVAVRVIVVRAG
jgi:hypothetical protein